jgi:hypothetical protein
MMKQKRTMITAALMAAVLAVGTANAPLWAGGTKDTGKSAPSSGSAQQGAAAQQRAEPVQRTEPVHTVTTADFEWVVVAKDGSSVSLENYKGSAANIVVPAELEGLPVREVALRTVLLYSDQTIRGYEENKTIRSVTIADGVGLRSTCFIGLTNLESVTLPRGLREIKEEMFTRSPSLRSLTIPDSVTKIGKYAFAGAKPGSYVLEGSGIKELVIPDSVTEIGEGVFFNNSVIERVTLPKNIKEIPEQMFRGAKNLKNVTLPEGLTTIGEWAFAETGIESIVIPESVTEINAVAFRNCKSLREVTLPKGLTVLAGFDGSGLKRITIPAGVRTIAESFQNCSSLEEVTFLGNTEVAWNTFRGSNIKKLIAGPGVTRIKGVEEIISSPKVDGLPLKEQAELKAAWNAFVEKYK